MDTARALCVLFVFRRGAGEVYDRRWFLLSSSFLQSMCVAVPASLECGQRCVEFCFFFLLEAEVDHLFQYRSFLSQESVGAAAAQGFSSHPSLTFVLEVFVLVLEASRRVQSVSFRPRLPV